MLVMLVKNLQAAICYMTTSMEQYDVQSTHFTTRDSALRNCLQLLLVYFITDSIAYNAYAVFRLLRGGVFDVFAPSGETVHCESKSPDLCNFVAQRYKHCFNSYIFVCVMHRSS